VADNPGIDCDGSPGLPRFRLRRCEPKPCCFPNGTVSCFCWKSNGRKRQKKQKEDVLEDTLALMVLKTLVVLGPMQGYGIAGRIEQISEDCSL
jgi:hypothetical protein